MNFRNEQYAGSGQIGPDGRYAIDDGLPAGNYSVFVLPPDIQTAPTFGMNQTDSPAPKEAENIPPSIDPLERRDWRKKSRRVRTTSRLRWNENLSRHFSSLCPAAADSQAFPGDC